MEKIATENLFLLEFLVDNVKLDPKCECDAPPGETCVSFAFLDNAPLEVCEADFSPKRNIRSENDKIKSGKSCLFSLSPDQANSCLRQFDVLIQIFKKMQPGWLPDKVEIGSALIAIANLFAELINSVETSDGNAPTAKTLKDTFDINDTMGKVIGKIGVYIRLSCFGKLIVTQFQMNLDDKSVLFKDKEGKSLYRYKKSGKGDKTKPEVCTPSKPQPDGYNIGCPANPCGGNQQNQYQSPNMGGGNMSCPFSPCIMDPITGVDPFGQAQSQVPCEECGGMINAPCLPQGLPTRGYDVNQGMGMMTPCMECGSIPYPPCLPPQSMGSTQRPNTPCVECANLSEAPCAPLPPPTSPPPTGNYQEIGAVMGDNSLTIRVHKDKSKVEQIDPNAPSDADDVCSCSQTRNGKKNQEQSFTMRPGVQQGKQNIPFAFRMGGSAGGGPGGNVVVNPPVATSPDGTQFTEFSDPNKELFILRIGKKSEGVDKKQNLELELCTPKGGSLKPIPKKETRDTQYNTVDFEEEGKKKDGKGKEKKDGKGKEKKDDKGKEKGKGKKKK